MLLSEDLRQFSAIDFFFDALQPQTPYARRVKRTLSFHSDILALEKQHRDISSMLRFRKLYPEKWAKLRWHLKKIPLLPDIDEDTFSTVDLFLFKKFLIHFKKISKQLTDELRQYFELSFLLEELLQKLSLDGSGEIFHLSDNYSPELKHIRMEIEQLDDSIQKVKENFLEELETKYHLNFKSRDFLLIPSEKAGALDSKLVYIEPFDTFNVLVRPLFPRRYFELLEQRSQIITEEKHIEEKLLFELSREIFRRKDLFERAVEALTRFDLAIAHAEMSAQYHLTPPHFSNASDSVISIEEGRFLPLEKICQEEKRPYQPLNAQFTESASLIYGSNMTGKTILLKTLAALQISAQFGFFVPAQRFQTPLFKSIHYIGNIKEEQIDDGLSAFGKEMQKLNQNITQSSSPALFIIDEFARTTNSRAATALTVGLLKWLNSHGMIRTFLSTHNDAIPPLPHTAALKMKGLDWEKLHLFIEEHRQKRFTSTSQEHLIEEFSEKNLTQEESLAFLHRSMRYELVDYFLEEDGGDALKVARLLGTKEEIIEEAFLFLKSNQLF